MILLVIIFSLLHSYLLGGGLFLQSWMANWQSLNIFSKIYLLFTNVFIFGQDIVMFLQLSTFLKKVLQGQQDWILNNFLGIATLF